MKINQVEELVGITKKNIRFYEEEGLLSPERDPRNGYREYSLRDVEQLRRIKLLRKLDVPCGQIRLVTSGDLSLPACMRMQQEALEKRRSDLSGMEDLCGQLAQAGTDFDSLHASDWLDRMKTLEKGGVQFMDAGKSDVKQKRWWGAVLSAAGIILFMAVLLAMIVWANHEEPLPAVFFVFVLLIPAGTIAGTALALYQRMKELKGGELDEADKY